MKTMHTTFAFDTLRTKFFLLIGFCLFGMGGAVAQRLHLSGTSILENVEVGYEIGAFSIIENGEVDVTEDYSIGVLAPHASNFSVIDNFLVSDISFDHERKRRYKIRVRARHNEIVGVSFIQEFTIDIEDVNERPTGINLTNVFVSENNEIGDVIGRLSTFDQDADDEHTYHFSTEHPQDSSFFTIQRNELRAAVHFDYETRKELLITIVTIDSGELSTRQSFRVFVDDVHNDGRSATDIILSNSIIDENNQPLTTVGLLTAEDRDPGDAHTFRLNNFNDEFIIEGDTLKTAIPLDYEIERRYLLSITAEDTLEGKFTKIITVNIGNANDAPTEINLSNSSVPENSDRRVVGLLSAEDQDFFDSLTFSLTRNPGGKFKIMTNRLVANTSFNYEEQRRYPITIETNDGSLSYEKDFVITIENANDAPSFVGLLNASISEDNSFGELVGELYTTDEDHDDNHSYSLVSNPDHGFKIVGNTLTAAKVFDFEEQETYDITIRSDDGNGGTTDSDLTVTIRAENDRVGPTLTSFSPLSGAKGINPAEDVFVATFNEPITYGKDVIEVIEIGGKKIIKAYVKPGKTFFIQGSQLFISFEYYAGNFVQGKDYYITIRPAAIRDLSENALVNPILENDFSWTFRTRERNATANGSQNRRVEKTIQPITLDTLATEIFVDVHFESTAIGSDALDLEDTEVIIYPNPVGDYVIVESENELQVDILDSHGEKQFHSKSNRKINLEGLNDGLYLIRVVDEKGRGRILRVIKKKN